MITCYSNQVYSSFFSLLYSRYQKDIITYIVIGTIFFSIFYYCVVFVAEVFAWHPACLLKLFASKKMRKVAKAARRFSLGLDEIVMSHDLGSNPMHLTHSNLEGKSNNNNGSSSGTGADSLRDKEVEDLHSITHRLKDENARLNQQLQRLKRDHDVVDSHKSKKGFTASSKTRPRKKTFDQAEEKITGVSMATELTPMRGGAGGVLTGGATSAEMTGSMLPAKSFRFDDDEANWTTSENGEAEMHNPLRRALSRNNSMAAAEFRKRQDSARDIVHSKDEIHCML